MFGHCSDPVDLASDLNRAIRLSSPSLVIILIATYRPIWESTALYTTPMPPRPITPSTSYFPIFVGLDAMLGATMKLGEISLGGNSTRHSELHPGGRWSRSNLLCGLKLRDLEPPSYVSR